MRVMLKVTIPVETGNAAVRAGKLGSIIQSILADLKPEAAYFTDYDGKRCGFIIVNLRDASQIPAMAEPFFLALNARLECHVVMLPEDLHKAADDIAAVAKKYG